MTEFEVNFSFKANVSNDAADVLEDLVEEFNQRLANVVVNDQIDQLAELIKVSQVYFSQDAPEIEEFDPDVQQAIANAPEFEYVDLYNYGDEGSDAPISAVNFGE